MDKVQEKDYMKMTGIMFKDSARTARYTKNKSSDAVQKNDFFF